MSNKVAAASTVNPGSSASGKGIGRSIEQKEKRVHSEVDDSNIGDELSSINKQLDQLSSEIKQTREEFKSIMKREEMKSFITNTVENLMKSMQIKLEQSLQNKLETRAPPSGTLYARGK